MDAECATYIHISFDAESAYLTTYAVSLASRFQLRDAPEDNSVILQLAASRER